MLKGFTEREIAELLRYAAALVFLSVDEGHPKLFMEALCAGCIVYAYDCGPVHFLPGAYRYKQGDISSIPLRWKTLCNSFLSTALACKTQL